ncbi:MAG: CDP-alcohol phosphatidyltransferase family protein [Fuerstiella sp.]|nr:CDP-alcohol phosphatidyltransferase family protein [Fuerstiella sp.]
MDPEPIPERGRRRRKVFAVLPTLLTLGNAVCGFGAIMILARVGPSISADVLERIQPADTQSFVEEQVGIFAEQMVFASWLIFLAMLFDALDGSAARLTNQTSEFGAQLDSLCDVISFGVAPAFLMLKLTHPNNQLIPSVVAPQFQFEFWPRFLSAFATLFVLCAVMRLARFNTETDEEDSHEGFSGLPSPAAAGVIASMPIGIKGLNDLLTEDTSRWSAFVSDYVLPALAVLLPFITLGTALLMVSRIHYPHLFNQLVRGSQGRRQIVTIVVVAVLVFTVHEVAIPILFCWFAFATPARALWLRYLRHWLPGSLRSKQAAN